MSTGMMMNEEPNGTRIKELEALIKELAVIKELTDENERLEVLLVDLIVSDFAKQDTESSIA